MNEHGGLIVAGGGIGGLAAALACRRVGWDVRVLERTAAFSDVGAGIQLGPNVVRILHGWGLAGALDAVAAFPPCLQVRSARSGATLGELPLGRHMTERYGAAYLTLHRADLHDLLRRAAQHAGAQLQLDQPLQSFSQNAEAIHVRTATGAQLDCDALIGADGLWSSVRQQLLGDGVPRRTGHLAYRALVPQASLPARLRTQNVTVWLAPRMHLVHYPVRGGESLNVVAFLHGELADEAASARSWDHQANAADLEVGLAGVCAALRELVAAVAGWRLWVMYDRPPMQHAQQQAQGRVALLGDAAHPMRPYLAQGAGMAIEDAAELARVTGQRPDHAPDSAPDPACTPAAYLPELLQRYAHNRWQRNARVQARALRNGQVFHADGWLRWGRDASLKVLGARVLDMPWLYRGMQGPA